MYLTAILTLAGGVGMFLFGMNLLSNALSTAAGEKMEGLLKKLTNSKLKGTFLGTLITGLIQSSAACALIVLGFVNAGIMSLSQGAPVLFGSNIGSTITNHILRLGDISSDMIFLTLLKPSSFAPLLIAVGAFMLLFVRNTKRKNIARIFIGFGLLFLGMTTMEHTMSTLFESNPHFQEFFISFKNPFLCLLVGIALTGVIQSAAATLGILQALTATGFITFSAAFPIIMGANIGKCVPVWLGCIGSSKKACRTAVIHTAFNVIGVLVLGFLFLISMEIFPEFSLWEYNVNRGNIADLHTIFNVATTLMLLPFSEKLVNFSGKIMHDDETPGREQVLVLLNDELLSHPEEALKNCRLVFLEMCASARESFDLAWKLLYRYSSSDIKHLNENENFMNKAYDTLNDYLVRLAGQASVTDSEYIFENITEMMHFISDFERIGDYCVKIAKAADYNDSNNVSYSDSGVRELEIMSDAARSILDTTMQSYENDDQTAANRVGPLRDVIHSLHSTLAERHVIRLQSGFCTVKGATSFTEIITDIDGIASHCSSIAYYINLRLASRHNIVAHFPPIHIINTSSDEYEAIFTHYQGLYGSRLDRIEIVDDEF